MNITIKFIKQIALVNPTMEVYLNGVETAWIGNGESETITAKEGVNTIKLKSSFRSSEVTFKAEKDVTINAKWNTITGQLKLLCNGEDIEILT